MGIVLTLKYAPLFHALAAMEVSDVGGAAQEEQAGLLLFPASVFPKLQQSNEQGKSFLQGGADIC